MPDSSDVTVDYDWFLVEREVEGFIDLLQQLVSQWRYNGAQLEQVMKIDVAATLFLEEVSDLLEELGLLTDEVPMVVSIIK
jgi:hypothetical protein